MSGNPLIKKEMELQTLIKDLKMEKARYSEHIYELQDNIRVKIPEKIHLNELIISHLQKDVDTASKAPKVVDEDGKETHPVRAEYLINLAHMSIGYDAQGIAYRTLICLAFSTGLTVSQGNMILSALDLPTL